MHPLGRRRRQGESLIEGLTTMIFWLLCFLLLLDGNDAMVIERGGKTKSSSPPSRRRTFNKSNSGNKSWYNKRRNNGIKVARRGTKPPKWEKEGDDLYREIVVDERQYENMSLQDAKQLLSNLQQPQESVKTTTSLSSKEEQPQAPQDKVVDNEPPFLWGGLSVGPVWKSRLLQNSYAKPNAIQKQAFSAITKRQQNVIIASPTGSGKSLAYLLPLLTTTSNTNSKKKKNATQKQTPQPFATIWIVTPTLELAQQLQRVANTLLSNNQDTATADSVIHVLNPASKTEAQKEPLLSSILGNDKDAETKTLPIMLAGPPRRYLELMRELEYARRNPGMYPQASSMLQNLQTIVLDEADRLLQTEEVATLDRERKELRDKNSYSDYNSAKLKLKGLKRPTLTFTQEFVSQIMDIRADSTLQLICASATVGRTLRRQVMELTRASSMDKAATLITADVRTKKDAQARKTSLLPNTLQHCYHVIDDKETVMDDNRNISPARALKVAILESLCTKLLLVDSDETEKAASTTLEPGPTLIFPGRIGVEMVQETLRRKGFQAVHGLENVGAVAQNNEKATSASPTKDWKTTDIYVVNEKMSRGLDLEGIANVFLLQVPKSCASYTHLAGRTGRNGSRGTAVTICATPLDAAKLKIIAETLGLTFSNVVESSLNSQDAATDKDAGNKPNVEETTVATTQAEATTDANGDGEFEWLSLSESALKRKTIAEISNYLSLHGVSASSVTDEHGKKPKKEDWLQAVHKLHSSQ